MTEETEWIKLMKELRHISEQKGYTLKTLDKESGVRYEVLSRIFTGKVSPTIRQIYKICKALKIQIVFTDE